MKTLQEETFFVINQKHDAGQREAFIKAAEAAETDNDEAKFNAMLKKVAKAKPPADDKKAGDDGKR